MSSRIAFIEHCGPGGLSGCTFVDWLRILCRAHFSVDLKFWPRAASITCHSALLLLWRFWEHIRYSAQIDSLSVPPPLFVLGIWRSGTTHLHNLLAQDDRFAFGNTYEVHYPHTFLSMEGWHSRAMQPFIPQTRRMDNVKYGFGEPQEDEIAMAACGLSFMVAMLAFPRTGEYYRRFLTLKDTTPAELESWKLVFMRFLRKLTLKHGRPLVLKSPGHTARIKVLLELFPDAKFVHIHRHPHEVFQSTVHTWQKVHPLWALQNDVPDAEWVIRDYSEVYEAFFEQRHLIPPGNFCEVSYDQLETNPIGQIKRIYNTLRLPPFDYVEGRLRSYLQTIDGYAKNIFPDLSNDLRERLNQKWSRCFEEWQYDK